MFQFCCVGIKISDNISQESFQKVSDTDFSRDNQQPQNKHAATARQKYHSKPPLYEEDEFGPDHHHQTKAEKNLYYSKGHTSRYKNTRRSQENLNREQGRVDTYYKHAKTSRYGHKLPSKKLDKYSHGVLTLVKNSDEDVIRNVGYRPLAGKKYKVKPRASKVIVDDGFMYKTIKEQLHDAPIIQVRKL